MPAPTRNSICSAGVPIDFFWWSCPGESPADHVAAAVAALWKAIAASGRRWNPYATAMVRAEFRRRVEKAVRGELVPVDEIKPVSDGRAALFEIRWSGVAVTEAGEGGQVRHSEIEVRMIHTEPEGLGLAAVGLHAHEKRVVQGDSAATHAAQDREIEIAERCYYAGAAVQWGIPERRRS